MGEFSVFAVRARRSSVGCAALAGLAALVLCSATARVSAGSRAEAREQSAAAKLVVDYPEAGSIFPPGIAAPTFLWRDSGRSDSWAIAVSFGDGTPAIHAVSRGEKMRVGEIDPECVAPSNELPKLTATQAETWTWKPDDATWKSIQQHSIRTAALFTVTGLRDGKTASATGHVAFTTSNDPVGAPIFYRDVPLMPSTNLDGTVQPLPAHAIHLIKWRMRDIREAESHTVLADVPTCLNCHSFSRDAKTMGIDLDGPNNDKGLYALAPVERQISIEDNRVVQWNTDGRAGTTRVGFMSQVSPDGRYVLSGFSGSSLAFAQTYYVRNFPTYNFLQVFYPTKGILEFYDRTTGRRQPLAGANDPRYVQTSGVWSADGKWIVFSRALAREPYDKARPLAKFANDPNETQIQYDLFRVPFNDGKGGTAERIVGASQNGMSNSFPKISPDRKWIVFVEAKNGEVMRPDSQLYIVPFAGGLARRLRANAAPMNSWHSWSPNGRWLVFSSKRRSPYTQMYLTHMDAEGNSSPAILVESATAANRAVNLPEFVDVESPGIENIKVPAIAVYRFLEKALDYEDRKDYAQAEAALREAVQTAPDDARIHNDLSAVLYLRGEPEAAIGEVREALKISPWMAQAQFNLGAILLQQGKADEAIAALETTLEMNAGFPAGEEALAQAYGMKRKDAEALAHWNRALAQNPQSVTAMVGAARIRASSADANLRDGREAVKLATHARDLTGGHDASVLDTLGAAFAEEGKFIEALAAAQQALELATEEGNVALKRMIEARMQVYREKRAYRN